ncbi:MAG: hormogonium polysaccharide biosynthesis protein HpsA [Nostoc sp. DedVER02]|uniref:hormogonium polysaccharide biosynthesis protein HpsA n=1 Tax=unclassified Nostoc TaxID=2593658 RepID=UPI002AD528FE|nr:MULTISPECIES: hormogonium polysaccharide biosynthesis protein HpsA [unclassified Nostoc]MDZ7988391.1 hormogonium polysaccharide biosynthesis protein HpsA [Nostoc sp. DedVER02]MDZ8112129.1 hormogonium polysaccharide biosynthesis protein HpsA [Nostoc sp. DedVER01b]
MSQKRQLGKSIQKTFRQIGKKFLSAINKQIIWLLRTFFGNRRRHNSANAGFILPTVAMVTLVVVLLTTAILFRSFERSKNANNVRVNEAVLNAATPGIDRARAKLNKLFQDGRLPRATPTDDALYSTLTSNVKEYTFGDETQLKLTQGSNELKTAWMYPVDTDNNGKFDSYTLYGIYFKNPPITNGAYTRARNSLEARTLPMTAGTINGDCGDTLGTSATLVGNTGWFKLGNKLKKAFFVYTATVPITSQQTGSYEQKKGNKGFSAIEYQQERIQLPLVNNAVVYEDDIEITPGPTLRLNGRIFTNSNLLTGGGSVTVYQVSSKASCFYEADNAKIVAGGNLGAGRFVATDDASSATKVHLYQGNTTDPTEVSFAKSVTAVPKDIAYNSLAYVQRINRLVNAQMSNLATTDPQEVKDGITAEKTQQGLASYTTDEDARIRRQQLETYFKKRTRRIPYSEVAFGGDALGTYATTTPLQGSGDELRAIDAWIYPTDPTDGKTATNYAKLTLNANGSTKLIPGATEPTKLAKELQGKEQYLGDRALVGNNLPEIWWDTTNSKFVGPNPQDTQNIQNIIWDSGDGTRTRSTGVETLANLGSIDRNQDWEQAAAQVPTSAQDPVGGLRVVTGAGIYLPRGYTTTGLPSIISVIDASGNVVKNALNIAITMVIDLNFLIAKAATVKIWSDMMPVASSNATLASITSQPDSSSFPVPQIATDLDKIYKPYLRMRATAVYHYKGASYSASNPTPIACVSSYYDPTDKDKSRNKTGLADVSPPSQFPSSDRSGTITGNSNNGIVYGPPTKSVSDYQNVLNYQADLIYENGRSIDDLLLKTALAKTAANRTLSEQSTIDAAICALQILDGTITRSTTLIPDGAIMEATLLDARQIKAIQTDNSATTGILETFTNADNGASPGTNYDLPTKDRQPLEVRVTVLDIDRLRQQQIGTGTASAPQEYLIPNSGIVYATRDDALPDLSAPKPTTGTDVQKQENQKAESVVDYKVDPTRRPNGIMLINGSKLWRTQTYRDAEKGLILASNLPMYVRGDFNLHKNSTGKQEEFTNLLDDDWGDFYSRSTTERNVNFACRSGDPRLPNCATGDEWRPAALLADSISLLSNNFREGFRNEGNYDSNDNLGNRATGFNSYVTDWYSQFNATKKWFYDIGDPGVTATTSAKYYLPKDFVGSDFDPSDQSDITKAKTYQGSSYLNNFVTPVQLVTRTREFATEVCIAADPANCSDNTNWAIATGGNCGGLTSSKTAGNSNGILGQPLNSIKTGTVASPPECTGTTNLPARIAFQRNADGTLVLVNGKPVVYGFIKESGTAKLRLFPYDTWSTYKPGYPEDNSGSSSNPFPIPWFKTQDAATGAESFNPDNPPLLSSQSGQGTLVQKPVLQIDLPFGMTSGSTDTASINVGRHNFWLQIATETTFNLIAATGDTPARPTEDNGGLHNFVRFLENWNPQSSSSNATKARISGAFMQIKRSAYADAPLMAVLSEQYKIANNTGTIPFYLAPTRQWGYDVALLSQSPDLFAQKLVTIPNDLPDEFFREVGRDDTWVKTLLCAKKPDASDPTSFTTAAIDADQSGTCP